MVKPIAKDERIKFESLEAFPTDEQIEKVHICGVIFVAIGTVLESVSVLR